MSSDESEDDVNVDEVYQRKCELLLDKCLSLQQDNEKLVYKIHHIRKFTNRYRKQSSFMISLLDKYNDSWRNTAYANKCGHFGYLNDSIERLQATINALKSMSDESELQIESDSYLYHCLREPSTSASGKLNSEQIEHAQQTEDIADILVNLHEENHKVNCDEHH